MNMPLKRTYFCFGTFVILGFFAVYREYLVILKEYKGVSDVRNLAQTLSPQRKNVVFIIVDDLRAEIGAFLNEKDRPWLNKNIITPHMDNLTSKSLVLTRAYVQQAICNPSRSSLLTGRRPDTINVHDGRKLFRKTGNPNIVTLPQFFRQSNYTAVGIGKVYHLARGLDQDNPYSWDKYIPFHSMYKENDMVNLWTAVPDDVTKQTALIDEVVTEDARQVLDILANAFKKAGRNFFLTVGFRRPHLPWVFPEKYLKYYPLESIDLPANPYAPYKMPDDAWFDSLEFHKTFHRVGRYPWRINSTLPESVAKENRRAYYCSVTFVDHQIGLVLDHIEALGLLDDTVIALIGDHGWQLGEHGIWGKNTNFEEATHAPLLLSIRGVTDEGRKSRHLVEFVDIFPTLVEAAGLKVPPTCPEEAPLNTNLCVEGTSFLPLAYHDKLQWKDGVISQYPGTKRRNTMGYSLRTDQYRYTEWWPKNGNFVNKSVVSQLFDLTNDPLEQFNRADDEHYADEVIKLSEMLKRGWRSLSPVQ